MIWLFMALLAIVLLAVLLPALLFLLAVLDPPRTEEGWRRELASTGGFEHIIIADAYRIHHRKGAKDGRRKKVKKSRASRKGLAFRQGVYASRSASADTPDLRVRRDKQILRNDGDNHQLPRRIDAGAFDRAFQDAPQGASSEASAPSPRPADEHCENRASSSAGTSQGVAFQAGGGGRAGSLIDAYDSPFWKKLVAHAEELGL